ncbi:MAG: lipopolysaccharide core heptose(I) kinase RfaP [Gammaproteobacteria bacterium]|nr:MAG: lipopolysaccharide core heptose(I) kinase RfaP [Gammaproteobacteria bacterium]
MEPYLEGAFAKAWPGSPLEPLLSMQGEVFRELEGRTTLRFEFHGQHYFLKRHLGVGWAEIAKNLLTGKLPVLGARNEWCALQHLRAHGVHVATPLVFAEQGCNPATRRSVLVMSELAHMTDLEKLTAGWGAFPPSYGFRKRLVEAVADTARTMHGCGVNHRDFYLCHLWLPDACLDEAEPVHLYVIDLHRAQIRQQVPRRWLAKDLGALYYSALNSGITRRDVVRFLRRYTGKSVHHLLREDGAFWQAVSDRAVAIYQRDFGKDPALPF